MTIPAYPLQWPTGWKRTHAFERARAKFGKQRQSSHGSWKPRAELTIAQATTRVRAELERMGIPDADLVISTNLQPRLDGLPRSGQRQPDDPGAAVYWRERRGDVPRCMAIDRYDRVEDNLAAIAATLEAMRAIERHGGAEILNRAFTGFAALPNPDNDGWASVLGVSETASRDEIEAAYRRLRSLHHPDHGGNTVEFNRITKAYGEATA
ncbi:MAG: J domain-containing protein [Rhodanobacteraceae bacterium]|nr:MAG: J domain-containing protein [Rhodanobacteraceae bacterium]